MKSITLLLLVILSFSLINARKHRSRHHARHHSRFAHKHRGPKETPSALHLDNHYGTKKSSDYYGSKPAQPRQKTPYYGVDFQKQYMETMVPQGCDIRKASYYQICDSIVECDMCAEIAQCGWCQALGACLPNCAKGECPYTFTFDRKKCKNDEHQIKAGCLTLPVAPEATHFINPELDNVPKQHIKFHHMGFEKEEREDLVAYNHQRAIVTAHDVPNNRIFDDLATVPVPLYHRNEHYKLMHGTEEKTVRAEDGVGLRVDPGAYTTHGIDTAPRTNNKHQLVDEQGNVLGAKKSSAEKANSEKASVRKAAAKLRRNRRMRRN